MGIYPDKDKAGKLTGKYRVEVQLKGRRARGKYLTLAEAQTNELRFRHELVSSLASLPTTTRTHDKRDRPQTLSQLFDKAKDSLWRGKATEDQSLQRCMSSIGIIGTTRPLGTLATQDIDHLIGELIEDKSPATVNRYLSALHTLLQWAQGRKYLSTLPTFDWQTEDEGRIRWITETEEQRLYDALGPSPVADVIKVAIATGLRRNELLGLDETTVEPEWVRLWETKTKTPRSVPITGDTYALLSRLMRDRSMPTVHQLRYGWETARESIGLSTDALFVFHATRHTCATRLVRANVNLRLVQRWLGHKRIETTLRYAHVNDEMLRGALGQIQGAASNRAGVGCLLPGHAGATQGSQTPTPTTTRSLPSVECQEGEG